MAVGSTLEEETTARRPSPAEMRDGDLNFGPLEEVDCAMCGGHDFTTVVTEKWFGSEFRVVRCRGCHLMFTNPRPSAEWKAHFYDPKYNPYLAQDERDYAYQQIDLKIPDDAAVWVYLNQLVPDGAKLLDGGCSSGHFVKAAIEHGYDASGFDCSPEAVDDARTRFGLNVFAADATDLPVEDNTYDVITLNQVFEHFSSPLATLRELQRVLKPSGVLYLETVNYLKLYWMERYLPFLKKPYLNMRNTESDWYRDRLPWASFDHYYHWTPATIKEAMRRAGFVDVENYSFRSPMADVAIASKGSPAKLKNNVTKTLESILVAAGRKPA